MHSATSWRRSASVSPASWARWTTSSATSPRCDRDLAGERVDGGVDGIAGFGAGAHRVDVVLVDAEGGEHGGVERDAIGVVDGDADRDAGDLAVHRREGRVGHRAAQGVEGGEQRRAGGGDGGQVGHEAEVGGDAVEDRLRGSGAVSGVSTSRFMATIIRSWAVRGDSLAREATPCRRAA